MILRAKIGAKINTKKTPLDLDLVISEMNTFHNLEGVIITGIVISPFSSLVCQGWRWVCLVPNNGFFMNRDWTWAMALLLDPL